MLMLLALLVACGGGTPAPTPPPATPPASVPAPPPPAAPVGPDGPESIVVPEIASIPTDEASIEAGEKIFTAKGCPACHKFDEKLVGPALKGVTERRSIKWIERMITDPDVMIKTDPVAKDLYRTLMTPMSKQGVSAEEMPKLLAYIKHEGG